MVIVLTSTIWLSQAVCVKFFCIFKSLENWSFVQGASKIKNNMARPTKLTPEVQENICNWLKLGYYQEDAAIMAGISASTYYEWMNKGEQERVALEEGEKALTLPDTSLPASEDEPKK